MGVLFLLSPFGGFRFKDYPEFSDAVAALSEELRGRGEKIIHNANSRNAFVGLLNAVAAIILGKQNNIFIISYVIKCNNVI